MLWDVKQTDARNWKRTLPYAIAALKPSPTEIIRTFENATGVTVDPEPGKLLRALDGSQLQAVWKFLSEVLLGPTCKIQPLRTGDKTSPLPGRTTSTYRVAGRPDHRLSKPATSSIISNLRGIPSFNPCPGMIFLD